MALQFTQEEVEKELSEKMPHGTRREVSRLSGIGESHLKRQFNPYDESVSCVFRTLQIACALDEIDQGIGDAFWAKVNEFRELSKQQETASAAHDPVHLNIEAGELGREISELIAARLSNRPLSDQLKEFWDVCRQLDGVKKAMINEVAFVKHKKKSGESLLVEK